MASPASGAHSGSCRWLALRWIIGFGFAVGYAIAATASASRNSVPMLIILGRSLGKCFGDDGRLLELDTEAQMDDGVVGALVHSSEHLVGELGA